VEKVTKHQTLQHKNGKRDTLSEGKEQKKRGGEKRVAKRLSELCLREGKVQKVEWRTTEAMVQHTLCELGAKYNIRKRKKIGQEGTEQKEKGE